MAAMLAHEVKNPLSGVRGAAQLLEESIRPEDRELTRLVVDEADRICALVDRTEVLSREPSPERAPVNINAVPDHDIRLARKGWARPMRLTEASSEECRAGKERVRRGIGRWREEEGNKTE